MVTTIMVGIVVGLFVLPAFMAPLQPDRNWGSVRADGNPGAGESGMVRLMIYPHDADPGTTYASNLTNDAAYAYGNTWNTSLTGDVPYAPTTFDIVVKARFNTTHAYSSGNTTWMLSWVNSTIRCPDLSINANTTMTKVQITTNENYMWVHFYMNNGGAGYTRTHGVTTNVTHTRIRAYF